LIYHAWNRAIEDTTANALKIAAVAEAGIMEDDIAGLSLDGSDLKKKEYIEIKYSLQEIVSAYDDIRFAYIFVLKNEKIYLAADSEPVDSEDYSPPGQEYTEATDLDKQPFFDGEAHGHSQYRPLGNMGQYTRAMFDMITGEVAAVLVWIIRRKIGIKNAITAARDAAMIGFCFILIYLSLVAVIRTNISIRQEKGKAGGDQ